ncbi:hypothetical protein C0584_04300 [Candidatus Parcubacteria bacterium]|nr:MAG: hypothetical protein C0584_04300 [Candidatus Parcubacteria bacterium]
MILDSFKKNNLILLFFTLLIFISFHLDVQAAGGDPVWVKTSNIPAVREVMEKVESDATGVYIVGSDLVPGNYQWVIEKRTHSSGALIWRKTSNPSSGAEYPESIAIDSTGIYVGGYDAAPGDNQWRIEKRNLSTGDPIWVKTFNLSTDPAYIKGLAVDATGLYVIGYDSGFGDYQWRIEKRNLNTGDPIWSKISNPSASADMAQDVAVDGTGVYIVGYDYVPNAGRWRMEKRNLSTGNPIWTKTVDPAPLFGDYALAVTVDSSGFYVGGRDSSTGSANPQWRIEKRNISTGDPIWTKTSNPSSSFDEIYDMDVDPTGLVVVGYDRGPGDDQWRIEKRDLSTGDPLWTKTSNMSISSDIARGVVIDSPYIYVTGRDWTPGTTDCQIRLEKRYLNDCSSQGVVCTQDADCCTGFCRSDYDGSPKRCVDSATECVYNTGRVSSGTVKCDSGNSNLLVCNNGSWFTQEDCGVDSCFAYGGGYSYYNDSSYGYCNDALAVHSCDGDPRIACATAYACNGTASKEDGNNCATSCTVDNQCNTGYICSAGSCVLPVSCTWQPFLYTDYNVWCSSDYPRPACTLAIEGQTWGEEDDQMYTCLDSDLTNYFGGSGHSWGDYDSQFICSCGSNLAPTATISNPTAPQSVLFTDSVSFTGSGNDFDGTISNYEWREGNCNTGALLSSTASFSDTFTVAGSPHQVFLRVQDNNGDWSTNCPSISITVSALPLLSACTQNSDCDSGFCKTDLDGIGSFCSSADTSCVYDAITGGNAEYIRTTGYNQCITVDDGYYTCSEGSAGYWGALNSCSNQDCKSDGDNTYSARVDSLCSGGACSANPYVDCGAEYACSGITSKADGDVCAVNCFPDSDNLCADNFHCYSGDNLCYDGNNGSSCDSNSECISNYCDPTNVCADLDATAPLVQIITPTTEPMHVVTTDKIDISGTSWDANGISSTDLENTTTGDSWSWGASNSWSRTNVDLDFGPNQIIATAEDGMGLTNTDSLVVYRLPPNGILMGYAWSDSVGWISFSSLNCDPDGNLISDSGIVGCPTIVDAPNNIVRQYQVVVDGGTGHLSGYAWSENVGWISFQQDSAGDPPTVAPHPDGYSFNTQCRTYNDGDSTNDCVAANNCISCYNMTDELGLPGEGVRGVHGWARILSLDSDGWIKLSYEVGDTGGVGYGMKYTIPNFEFSGFSWNGDSLGSAGLGWFSLSSKNCDADVDGFSDGLGSCPPASVPVAQYSVVAMINIAPSVAFSPGSGGAITELPCTSGNGFEGACVSDCEIEPRITWLYDDPEGFDQEEYQIIIDAATGPEQYDSGRVTGSTSEIFPHNFMNMEYDQTYDVSLNTWDNFGLDSGWVYMTFTTDEHKYPDAAFDWFIDSGSEDEQIKFWDKSIYYINDTDDPSAEGVCHPGYSSSCTYSWSSADADIYTPTTASTTAIFRDAGTNKQIKLEVADGDGYMCASSTSLDINLRLPNWIETR